MNEEWKDINGYEGLYQVSNLGRVKSFIGWNGHKRIEREKIINGWTQTTNKGYKRKVISLRRNKEKEMFMIHQLVLNAFMCNAPEGKVCNHIDGDSLNNKIENLEWVTQQQNVIHAYETGLTKRFQISKEEMEDLYVNKLYSIRKISECLGVTPAVVYRNFKRHNIKARSVSETSDKYNLTSKYLKTMFKKGYKQKEISKLLGCDSSLISHSIKKFKKNGEWTI